ncbi:SGNH/GDSL hydrolase family protein [Micromonospora sp. STR1_7]|uniref:SGNH/GDSL hydrolase family protein n=1 Tax=Micromonospora parastrephiae TaxID=2806101 RepID=A0ABS1XSG1_9ACTN|nr:GDSL-type esterase/lipase family protein [Micromonospora parastrephiae]MBM0232212.1 SGNH/GDSL hydrolase family protein [Micromonospora parastrephiae]
MIWTAGFRTAVISPYEQLQFSEPRGFADQTVRQVLHMAGGGEAFRVRLTNRYGRTPLTIAAATVVVGDRQAVLTVGGAERWVIPAGGEAVADPVDLPVAAGADLVVSLYLPERTGLATHSHKPAEVARIAHGNHVTSSVFPWTEQVEARYYISGVDVLAPPDTAIAVAFGDSWFEGVGTTTSANHRSVDVLNRRLRRGWVVNQGIAGNRLLRDGVGEHALARFDRDVLSIPAVTHVLVHFGINDIGLPGMLGEPPTTADALVEGFGALADRAHGAGLKILAATIGPFAGAGPGISTPEGLAVRRAVNDWIRTTDAFDAVVDVARAVADPRAPDYILPALDSGDGMHLNDRGAGAMVDAVDLDDLAL